MQTLHHVLRRLAAGEMNVKGNFIVEFGYGLKQGHTSEQWKAILPDSYFWVDYMCMPQPLASLPDEQTGPAAHAGQVGADHRLVDGAGDEEVSVLIDQLKAAVDSIPAYIENCTEMFVVVPSIKHADRAGCVCDFSTWRSRGWCRMEFVSTRLACHGDIPVMVINSREKTPTYFNLCDTMKLFAGNGNFTVDDDKKKVKGGAHRDAAAKSVAEFDKGNVGLSRGHVLLASAFLDGLPKDEAALPTAGRRRRRREGDALLARRRDGAHVDGQDWRDAPPHRGGARQGGRARVPRRQGDAQREDQEPRRPRCKSGKSSHTIEPGPRSLGSKGLTPLQAP